MSDYAPQLTAEAIWQYLDQLTKPPRSLGKLEDLAARLCSIQQTLKPRTTPRRMVLFAGDHGVVESGVSAWPAEVTELMIRNLVSGGAACSVLARQSRTQLHVIDVGSQAPEGEVTPNAAEPAADAIHFRDRRVRRGTRNLALEPALTPAEFRQALAIGRDEAARAAQEGVAVIAAGEMGIGNTTPSACLSMLLADAPLDSAVGRGAGADDDTLARKRSIVAEAVARSRQQFASEPLAAIAGVAGLEIAAMAGLFLGAREAGRTIVLDGFIATAAALIAEHLEPGTAGQMIAGHLSAESGHRWMLKRLGLVPFLDWNLRLGEGTGALLLMPLLDAAAAISTRMATFADLGIAPERPS